MKRAVAANKNNSALAGIAAAVVVGAAAVVSGIAAAVVLGAAAAAVSGIAAAAVVVSIVASPRLQLLPVGQEQIVAPRPESWAPRPGHRIARSNRRVMPRLRQPREEWRRLPPRLVEMPEHHGLGRRRASGQVRDGITDNRPDRLARLAVHVRQHLVL